MSGKLYFSPPRPTSNLHFGTGVLMTSQARATQKVVQRAGASMCAQQRYCEAACFFVCVLWTPEGERKFAESLLKSLQPAANRSISPLKSKSSVSIGKVRANCLHSGPWQEFSITPSLSHGWVSQFLVKKKSPKIATGRERLNRLGQEEMRKRHSCHLWMWRARIVWRWCFDCVSLTPLVT